MNEALLDPGGAPPDPGTPPPEPGAPAPDPGSPPPADFESLLAGVLERAYGTALHLTRNREDAEDLVQEAATNAFRYFHTFRPGSNFRAWFFRILTNCFYSSRRSRRPMTSLQELEDTHALYLFFKCEELRPAGSTADPGRMLLDRLAAEDIARALQSLPEEYRVVSTLYFMEDFSYQEIADVLAVPIGTVRSRLHRGRQLLQKKLWALAEDRGIVPAGRPPVAANGAS